MKQRKPTCPACLDTVVVERDQPIPYKQCLGPGTDDAPIPCPLNQILQTIERDRSLRETAKSSQFLG